MLSYIKLYTTTPYNMQKFCLGQKRAEAVLNQSAMKTTGKRQSLYYSMLISSLMPTPLKISTSFASFSPKTTSLGSFCRPFKICAAEAIRVLSSKVHQSSLSLVCPHLKGYVSLYFYTKVVSIAITQDCLVCTSNPWILLIHYRKKLYI